MWAQLISPAKHIEGRDNMKPLSLWDFLPIPVVVTCLIVLSLGVEHAIEHHDTYEWDTSPLFTGPVVWTITAIIILIAYVWDRKMGQPSDYGHGFSTAFLIWVIAAVMFSLIGILIAFTEVHVSGSFNDKVLLGTLSLGLAQFGLGAVFRPHMTCNPAGLAAWALVVAYGAVACAFSLYFGAYFMTMAFSS